MKISKLFKILIAVLVLEVLVFNYRHWESLAFREAPFLGVCSDSAIELTGIDAHVSNLYLDPFSGDQTWKTGNAVPLQIEVTDEANALYMKLPDTEIVYGIPESFYKRLYLSGKTEKIRISFPEGMPETFALGAIRINAVRPFLFCLPRVLILFCIGCFLMVFRPGGEIYKIPFSFSEKRQRAAVMVWMAVNMAAVAAVGLSCLSFNWAQTEWLADLQYNYLAESLLEGRVSLGIEPPACLLEMENPYDYAVRAMKLKESGETLIMDLAYYNGKYYSYFGIVPVILFYIPCLLLTGRQPGAGYIILALGILFVPAAFWYVRTCIRKYWKSVSLGLYLLLSSVLVFGGGILYLVQNSTIYSLPFLLSLLLNLLGITCWMHAANQEEGNQEGKLHKGWLLAGGICIALVMGCRPSLAIALFLAFPLFWKEIRERKFFSKQGAGNTIAVMAPFFLIGFALMGYNYARFGSFLDFGAAYNMTGFDMTHRGFVPERFKLGFFEYFFQPLTVRPRFPYVYVLASHMGLVTDHLGQTINEPFLGGYFAMNLVGLPVFLTGSFRKQLREKGLYVYTLMLLLFSVILVGLDTQMVGITARYLSDFSMFMTMAAEFVILAALQDAGERGYREELQKVFVILMILCIFTNLWLTASSGIYADLKLMRPRIYYWLKYLSALSL